MTLVRNSCLDEISAHPQPPDSIYIRGGKSNLTEKSLCLVDATADGKTAFSYNYDNLKH